MSAMPPPPPPGGDQSGYQSAPSYSPQGGMAAPGPTSAPPSIVRAKYAMWAGALLQLISIPLSFMGMDDVRTQVEQSLADQGLPYTQETVDAAVALGVGFGVVIGVIGVILWLLMAWLNGKGKGWARVVATVFFALFVVSFLTSFLQPTPMATMLVNVLVLIAGAAATFFLWQKDSSAWFRAHKAPTV